MNNKEKFGRVAVLMGGEGAEREVSLKSGKGVLAALLEQGVDAFALDTQNIEQLKKLDFDRAYIVLHGGNGENGEMQGFLKTLKIPFTGCDVLASAITMDKIISKSIWKNAGLPVLPWVEMSSCTDAEKEHVIKTLGLPLALKPPAEGSSFGVSKVKTAEEFDAAYALARKYDDIVLAEPWVTGREFAVPVIDGEAFPIVEIIPSKQHEFFDFEAKYTDNSTEFPCPCDISDVLRAQFNEIALAAYKTTQCSGMVRVDFKTDLQGHPWLFEINTVPGYTSTSLVPRSTKVAGLDFNELVMRVLTSTL